MKKSFSKLNLLSQDYISPFKGGLSKWLQLDTASLTITLPYYDYLRGVVFVDDLKQVFDVPDELDLGTLLSLLHDDFLYHTQKGVRSHQETVTFLLNGKRAFFNNPPKPKPKEVIKQVKLNTFIFVHEEELTEEEEARDEEQEGEKIILELTVRKSKIQRTEILLYDLSQHMEQERTTVEELIAILYLDFIERIKKGGNNEKVMRAILSGIEFYK